MGASLTYAIADNIWAEAAYNYDELDSDIPHRSFERNYCVHRHRHKLLIFSN